jgi:hypothetical protein
MVSFVGLKNKLKKEKYQTLRAPELREQQIPPPIPPSIDK